MITAPLRAKFYAYGDNGEKKCIHVVGPDLRSPKYDLETATLDLSEAYSVVLLEFLNSDMSHLRLLPISS
eukprot:7644783-Lingulodinium_polyedra.AAC.1